MRQRIFYGWVMTGVAFVVILIGAGTRAAPGASGKKQPQGASVAGGTTSRPQGLQPGITSRHGRR
jgi:hypothetical protein